MKRITETDPELDTLLHKIMNPVIETKEDVENLLAGLRWLQLRHCCQMCDLKVGKCSKMVSSLLQLFDTNPSLVTSSIHLVIQMRLKRLELALEVLKKIVPIIGKLLLEGLKINSAQQAVDLIDNVIGEI